MKLFLAIDQGGHASRALAFDESGAVVAQGYAEIAPRQPQPDHVEYDARAMIASVRDAVARVADALGPRVEDIAAAGIATQRSTVACWDRQSGEPLSPVISWQDRRAATWMEQFTRHDEDIHSTTGLFVTAHYGVSKLHWCLEHIPAVRKARQSGRLVWGPLSSFLVFQLTRERKHVVDPANASRTLLWNFQTLDWDDGLLDLFGLPLEPMPRCVPTCYEFGEIDCGGVSIPLRVVTGDQSAALFAYGMPHPQTAYINIGTGAFVQRLSGGNADYSPRLLTSVVLQRENEATYVLEGTVNGAGGALIEIENSLGMDAKQAEQNIDRWMREIDAPPLFLNGVSGLGSPYWIARFPTRFSGTGTNEAKLVAVADSIAFLLYANLEEMSEIFIAPRKIVVTGGLSRIGALCQRLADLSGALVVRPGECEATARGTAFLLAGQPAHWLQPDGEQQFAPVDNDNLTQRYARWKEELLSVVRQARMRVEK